MKQTRRTAIGAAQVFREAGISRKEQPVLLPFKRPILTPAAYSGSCGVERKIFVIKHLLFICLFGCLTSILQSQPANDGCWEWKNPTSGQDVFFVNNTTGWAVGYAGTIIRTTDGGASWQQQCSGTEDTSNPFFSQIA